MIERKYGCIKGQPPSRFTYKAVNPIPPHVEILNVDLRKHPHPTIIDQGQAGSCTGHGTRWAIGFAYLNDKKGHTIDPSPLFLYWNGRAIEGATNADNGAVIDDVVNGAMQFGCCDIGLWADDASKVLDAPPQITFDASVTTKVLTSNSVDNSHKENILQCLYDGVPVIFGMEVYESFESDEVAGSGIMPFPDVNNEQFMGGHCVCIVGYEKPTDTFIVANSWADTWGDKGYFHAPASYITSKHCSDFRTVETVS